MSRPSKRTPFTATLRAIHYKRARGFRRVRAAPQARTMNEVLAAYQPLYGQKTDKGESS